METCGVGVTRVGVSGVVSVGDSVAVGGIGVGVAVGVEVGGNSVSVGVGGSGVGVGVGGTGVGVGVASGLQALLNQMSRNEAARQVKNL